jgi:hypothetical protein
MTFREPRLASKQFRAFIALVARGLIALLFTFYVNYVPFHLLSERHLNHDLSSAQLAAIHFDDQDSHDGHHKPHPSSEHCIQILTNSESLALCLAFLPAIAAIVLDAPDSAFTVRFVGRIWPPGVSPPHQPQPRAPPIA